MDRDPFSEIPSSPRAARRFPWPVESGDDPFAEIPTHPSAASMFADAGESMGGELRQLAGRGLASTARTAGQQVGLLGRAANALTGGNIVVAAPIEWAAGKIRDTGASIAEKIDEMTGAPQTTGERIAGAVGTAAPVVASYALAGKAAGSLPAGASFASRVGAQVLAGAPVTAAIEGDQQDGSLAQTLGRVTGSDTLNRLSETAGGRMAVGLAGDVLGAGAFEGLASGFRGAGRLLRGGERAAPRSLDEAADEILRQHGAMTQPAAAEATPGRASTWGDLMPPDAPPPAAPAPRPPVPPVPAPAEPVAVPSVRDAAPPAGEPVPLKRRAAFAVDRSLEEELRVADRAAHTDDLTGLANKRAYKQAIARAEADPNTEIVLFDGNGNKAMNDTHGHKAGDDLIAAQAAAVQQAAEEAGVNARVVFRHGGDEYAVFAPKGMGARVRDRAEEIFGVRDVGEVRTSLSGGVGATEAEADAAAYARKVEHKAAQAIGDRKPDVNVLAATLSKALGRPVDADEAAKLLLAREGSHATGAAARNEAAGLGGAAHPHAPGGAGDLGGRPADLGDTGRGAAPAAAPGAAPAVAAPAVPAGRQPFAEMRTAAGRLRPVVNVSDDGLIREMSALMDRRGAQDTSHRLAETDYGDVLTLGSSRQGRAIQRVNDDTRLIRQISAELERRGWTGERMGERALELTAEADERAALQGDFDASKTDFSPDRYGRTSVRALAPLVGGGAGAVAGSRVGDTPEERRRNAAIGAVAGAGLGYLGARLLKVRGAVVQNAAGLHEPGVGEVLSSMSTRKAVAPTTEAGEFASRAYRETTDGLYPLRQFGRQTGLGQALDNEVTRAAHWEAAAASRVRTELTPVLEKAKGIEAQVAALSIAERAIELAKNGLPNKGVDLAAAQRAAASLSKIPQVREATDMLRAYYRSLLDHKLANGVISQEAYDALVKKGEHYVPFVRDFLEDVRGGGTGGGNKLVQKTSGVRKMTDAEATSLIRNPFEQAIYDTALTERAVSRQRVSNLVAQGFDGNPEAASAFLKEVPANAAGREGRIVKVNQGGAQRTFEITDPALYDAWAGLAPESLDLASKFLGKFKRALQAGTTLHYAFTAANAIRDAVHTAIATPAGVKRTLVGGAAGAAVGAATSDDKVKGALEGAAFGAAFGHMAPHVLRTLDAMGDIIGHGLGDRKIYEEWAREGGQSFAHYPRSPLDAQKFLEQQMRGGFDLSKIVNPKTYLDVLRHLNSVVEEAPRLARYKQLRAQGAAFAEAAAGGHDVSLDFARSGSGKAVKMATSRTAFLNPKIQGWDKLFRMFVAERNAAGALRFGAPQAKAWATAATVITAPSVALWAINKDNPGYWNRPLWERNLFWLVPDGEGGFHKIPKPFELGYAFASAPERLLDYAYQKNPGMLKDAFTQMATSTIGELPLSTFAQPIIENMAGPGGYSFFRGQPVVSSNLQRLPSELQYDDRTSSLARGVNAVTGYSPQKADNLVQGWTGQVGQSVSSAITGVARSTGLDDRGEPTMPQDRGSFAQRFTSRPDATPAQVTRFYSVWADAEKFHAGLEDLQNRGESAAVQKFLTRNERKLQDYYRMKPIADAIKQLNEARRAVEQDTSTPVEERRRQILEFRQQAAELAQQAIAPQP